MMRSIRIPRFLSVIYHNVSIIFYMFDDSCRFPDGIHIQQDLENLAGFPRKTIEIMVDFLQFPHRTVTGG